MNVVLSPNTVIYHNYQLSILIIIGCLTHSLLSNQKNIFYKLLLFLCCFICWVLLSYPCYNNSNANSLKNPAHSQSNHSFHHLRSLYHSTCTHLPTQLHPSDWTILFLCLYFIIFFLYTLKTYGIFHYPPTQPNEHLSSTNISAIFKFKLVQERRA